MDASVNCRNYKGKETWEIIMATVTSATFLTEIGQPKMVVQISDQTLLAFSYHQ